MDIFNEYVQIREEKFGTVIFETLREKVFVTNETGKEIINLLQKGMNVDEIVEILRKTYPVAYQEIRKDVLDFIEQLKDNHILTNQ